MGAAADLVAAEAGISRSRQDDYAAESHRKAFQAQQNGTFEAEIVSVLGQGKDERPRPNMTPQRLAKLPPAFTKNGTCTAGNSCGVNDGAAFVTVTSEKLARARGLPALRIIDWEVAGVDPDRPGLSPVPATQKLLSRNKIKANDLDVVEFNEAFAGQVLACLDALEIPSSVVSPDGGAIALGHPWGASGAVLMVRLFSKMIRENIGKLGLAMIAAGGGQGIAMVVSPAD
jgi:acetyl-CoA C-acetyltransferase